MESFHLPYRNSRIHCLRFGQGPKMAVCFHGYGETADSFAFLEKYAGHLFTFYAIDLPFHGETDWNDGALSIFELKEMLTQQLNPSTAQHLNPSPPHPLTSTGSGTPTPQRITFLGFSLGGRVALALYEIMPDQIEKLILLAPDGLKLNFWYWLSTQTWAGNRLFAFTMKHPGWFLGFIKLLNKLKLVNASIFKFINYYIGDVVVRDLLYKRWTGLRHIRPDIGSIKEKINSHDTRVELVYGKYDRIILSSVGEKFRKKIEPHTTIRLIHAGHQVLQEKHIEELMKVLQS